MWCKISCRRCERVQRGAWTRSDGWCSDDSSRRPVQLKWAAERGELLPIARVRHRLLRVPLRPGPRMHLGPLGGRCRWSQASHSGYLTWGRIKRIHHAGS